MQIKTAVVLTQTTSHQHIKDEISGIVQPSWILLDSGSTFNSFCNQSFLGPIASCSPMRSISNGGHLDYTQAGPVKLLPLIQAHYNENSIANIVSLADVAANYRVTMDSNVDKAIFVHAPSGTLRFQQCGNGLYYFDVSKTTVDGNLNSVTNYSFFSTVHSNKEHFLKREITGADNARILQARIGWPSKPTFIRIVTTNQIQDCPITSDNIQVGEAIYGPLVPILQGKMVRQSPRYSATVERIPLPAPIAEHHKKDDMSADFLFVQG